MSFQHLIYLIIVIEISFSYNSQRLGIPRIIFDSEDIVFDPLKSIEINKSKNENSSNETCKKRISKLFKDNVKDPLFRPFIEYGGKGIYNYGNFHLCQNSPNMTYFMISIAIGTDSTLLGSIGSCFPSACTDDTLQLALEDYIKEILPFISSKIKLSILDSKSFNIFLHETSYGFYICIFLLIIYLVIVLTGTIRKYIVIWFQNNNLKIKDSKLVVIHNCFNLKDNVEGILKTENKVDAKLNAFQLLRCIGILWVVIGHSYSEFTNTTNYLDELNQVIEHKGMALLRNATISVDIFFVIGGFLSAMQIISAFEKEQNRTLKNLLLLYFHRYVRLFPLMFICWIISSYFLPGLTNGVDTTKIYANQQQCKTRFIQTFLYIDNYFINFFDFCNLWIWYLYIDMQLFIFTPLILFPAFKNIMLGILILILLSFLSYGYQIYLFNSYHMSAAALSRTSDYETLYYQQPFTRCNVYFMGIFFCYLYFQFKGKTLFQSKILKFINQQFKNRIIRIIVFISAFGLMILAVFSQNWFDHAQNPIPQYESTIFLLLNRVIFALGVMFLVYPMLVGFSRPLSSFFSNPFFNVMGKLTFGTYMIHFIIIYYLEGTNLSPLTYSFYPWIIKSLSLYFFSYIISFVISALFESPIVQLLKLLTQTQNKSLLPLKTQEKSIEGMISEK